MVRGWNYCAGKKVSAFSEIACTYRSSAKAKSLPSEGCREEQNAIRTHQYDLLVLNMNRTCRRHGRKAARFLGFDRSMELELLQIDDVFQN
jgi:hypothetical protein